MAEAQAPVVRQFQCQGLDLEVRRLDRGRVLAGLVEQFLNSTGDPFWEFGSGVQAVQFSVQIHAGIVPANRPRSLMNRSFQR